MLSPLISLAYGENCIFGENEQQKKGRPKGRTTWSEGKEIAL
jgi:hypothetical protein